MNVYYKNEFGSGDLDKAEKDEDEHEFSILDTDMYKFYMLAAILKNFKNEQVVYLFINRSNEMKLNKRSIKWLKEKISNMKNIVIKEEEIEYLRSNVPSLPEFMFDFLKNFKFDPDKQIKFFNSEEDTDNFELYIIGSWKDTTLYEIPILSLISEGYFKMVDTDWNYEGQCEKAQKKFLKLAQNNCKFIEFGTRRRRSFKTQEIVIESLKNFSIDHPEYKKYFLGTSNVLLAKKYGIMPFGTVGHEWFMGVASITNDYKNAMKNAMDFWIDTFPKSKSNLMLTDTFGTDSFLKTFVKPYSDYYKGVRHDSNDPLIYAKKIASHYEKLGYSKMEKTICFSDSLDVEKCIFLNSKILSLGLLPVFGIGTHFTNDFTKCSDNLKVSSSLNIVIKLSQVNGNPAIKISDSPFKSLGDQETIMFVKKLLQ